MNTHKLLVSVLIFVSVLFSACAPAATATQAPISPPSTDLPASTQAVSNSALLGDLIPENLLNVDYLTGDGKHLTALRLLPPSDPFCQQLNTQGNCFMILQPNKTGGLPQVRGPAALVDGLIAVKFQSCPYCDSSEIGGIEYFEIQEDGGALVGVKCETNTGAECDADVGTTWKPATEQTTLSSKFFQIPMQVTYNSDWVGNSDTEWLAVGSQTANLFIDFLIVDAVTLREKNDPPTFIPFPEDFAGYLQSTPFWSEVTPATAVNVGGVDGIQMDALGESLVSNTDKVTFLNFENSPFSEFLAPTTQKFRFIYLNNVVGKKLLIVIGSTLSITEFDAFMPEVQEVLDTVTFGG